MALAQPSVDRGNPIITKDANVHHRFFCEYCPFHLRTIDHSHPVVSTPVGYCGLFAC